MTNETIKGVNMYFNMELKIDDVDYELEGEFDGVWEGAYRSQTMLDPAEYPEFELTEIEYVARVYDEDLNDWVEVSDENILKKLEDMRLKKEEQFYFYELAKNYAEKQGEDYEAHYGLMARE